MASHAGVQHCVSPQVQMVSTLIQVPQSTCALRSISSVSYRAISPIAIHIANHAITHAVGIGEVALHASTDEGVSEITLQEVFHVPELRANLIYIRKIAKKKFSVIFDGDHCKLFSSQGELIALGKSNSSDLYRLQASSCSRQHPSIEEHKALSVHSKTSADLWHQRLGHLNGRSLQLLHQHKMVTGLDAASDLTGNCVGCVLGKTSSEDILFSSSILSGHKLELELVHIDLCGPMDESSLGGKHYLLTFIDDCTRRAWACFLQAKSETLQCFQYFKAQTEKQTGLSIKGLRHDRGGEYTSNGLQGTLSSESGIIQELTEAYSPQQNGVAERANRTLVEMARSMLYHHSSTSTILGRGHQDSSLHQEQMSNHQTGHCDSRRSMDRAQAKCKSSSDFRLCWLLSCCRCEQEKVGGQIQAMCVHRV